MPDYYTERYGLMMLRPFEPGDRMVYQRIFINEELKPLLDIENVKLIVDCGAHVGMAGRYLSYCHPQAEVLSFEPEIANFQILAENFPDALKNGMAQSLNLAVWSHEVSLGLAKGEKTTSHRCYLGGNEIEALPLTFILDHYDKIDILKISIEGSEKHLFNRGTGWILKTRNIAIKINKGCEEIVMAEMNKYKHELIKSGEYTIFKNIGI